MGQTIQVLPLWLRYMISSVTQVIEQPENIQSDQFKCQSTLNDLAIICFGSGAW